MPVFTQPGHRQLTPTGISAALRDVYNPSVIATTACLLASYGGEKPGYRPAIDAVFTIWPPPDMTMCGRKAR
ncbi:MAG: hypothetical protein P8H61_06630, partial [Ilumatobacter sp.]|nr:hypothetical protein [Ilumatobacter sp.]